MGVYYFVVNHTTKQTASRTVGNWKYGEWSWDELLSLMGWSKTDDIVACGDDWSVLFYNNGKVRRASEEEQEREHERTGTGYENKQVPL